jgi:very-short-patch-repair endonuclease
MLFIARPEPREVLGRVRNGEGYGFRALQSELLPEAGVEDEDVLGAHHLGVDRTPDDLSRIVRGLYRKSTQAYLDQGLSILYLAFGTLAWTDVDHTAYKSPLLLVPVRLETAGLGTLATLEPTEDDTLVNPALALKLDQFGVTLPPAEAVEGASGEVNLAAFLDKVRAAVAGHKDWTVTDDLTLSYFTFAKEAMYRDLLDNEELIAGHETVQALALGGAGVSQGVSDRFDFDEITDRDIDEKAPPEVIPLILDADSSQRACVTAALAGKSFVMDGPPGTGKSQTIANIIGVLLHAGKTVLFVSEKAAALDVVRNRLADRGLGPYLLELHSAKATRKQVAEELGRALLTEQVPPRGLGVMDTRLALLRRNQLNQYADAMNRKRDPLGMSLHQVLGQIALLHDTPAAPIPVISAAELAVERYSEVMEAARVLSRAWRPARQGASFAWRGVTERGAMESHLQQASSALATLSGTAALNDELAELTGLTRPSDASALAVLLGHLSARPAAVPSDWLIADSLAPIEDAIAKLDALLAGITAATDRASGAAGTTWQAIPQPETLPSLPDLGVLFPPAPDVSGARADEITALAVTFRDGADMLANRAAFLGSLAGMLGLRPPLTFAEASDLLSLTRLAEVPLHPERLWLTLAGHGSALAAADALRSAADALAAAESAALAYYMPQAFNEDAAGLVPRLGAHHGLGKLSGGYRAGKKTIAAFTAPGVSGDAAQRHLGLVVAWQNAARSYATAEQAHARALGSHYDGRATNFTAVAQALRTAEIALRLARGQDTARVADYLADPPDAALTTMATVITDDLQSWRTDRTTPPELLAGTIADAIAWLHAQRELLEVTAAVTLTVGNTVDQPLTAARACTLVSLRDTADAAYDRLAAFAGDFNDTFGALYAGRQTDLSAVMNACAWASRLRELVTGNAAVPLTDAQAKAATTARMTPSLDKAAATWLAARDSLLAAFHPYRHASLTADLDDYEEADDLIKTLRQDTAGQDEWHAYRSARSVLEAHGMQDVTAFCERQRVPAEQVSAILQRAILQGWAECVLREDKALSVVRAAERDALVAEYRKVDEALIQNVVGDIIGACNARRPRTDIGESAIIAREAGKKRKHMPVRTLLERTRNVTLAVKPCFMMSPLTVSQFLPSDLRFDVVIFDEGSQILPGDAINCVYRGSSLILAGDQKQLSPTSWMFGGTGTDDGEDWSEDADDTAEFQSVLELAKGAGVFRNLSLRWHRRSRHEALIAFSNFSFYDGKIITFPGAGGDGPDVGVELFHVEDGVYRRGTSRDNPVEAAKVAERVIHHYATRPGMSLGVVAFSEAQAGAIDAAVTAARALRPDLEQYFNTDDRLRGFFVKNLETIQGDERDVLIFSVGYGPDENRKLHMNFGPLIKPGGWRRLNVAITRARYRNEIVSSIRAGDISGSSTSEGTRHLRRYLDYAERGMPALALEVGLGGDAESPFEESVINVIRSWGYEVAPQVGTAGYRIDIGVRHPSQPGAFCLGVECDGYQYHSSRAARDRDRLREEVLRGLGWRLHRIWGTAWYRDRNGAEAALRAAIEQAAVVPVTGLLPATTIAPVPASTLIVTLAVAFTGIPVWVKPYDTTSVPRLLPWVDPGEAGNGYYMADSIRHVVGTEGPVHIEVLHARLRDAWDIGRIGKNVRDNIDNAIAQAGVIRDGDFLMLPGGSVTVRTPTAACKRTIGQVHDSELDLALVKLVRDAAGIGDDDLTARVARIYGWERRGPDITARLRQRIAALLDNGILGGTPGSLTPPHTD